MFYLLAVATAFNMVCAGTVADDRNIQRPGDPQPGPYETVYRIDLDRGQWCDGDCTVLHDGILVVPPRLILHPGHQSDIHGISINRATGEHRGPRYTAMITDPGGPQRRGQCREAEFTGFPEHARNSRR